MEDAPRAMRASSSAAAHDLRSRAMCLFLVGALLSLAVVRYAGG